MALGELQVAIVLLRQLLFREPPIAHISKALPWAERASVAC